MFRSRIASGVIASILLVGSATAAQTPIVIEKWPDDVPCNVLKKYPDGTYEITVPYTLYYTTHTGLKMKNTRETRYWDVKCKGKTL